MIRKLILALLAGLFSGAALAADPPYYERKATWHETMFGARQALAKRDEQLGAVKEVDLPAGVTLGTWWSLGPFEVTTDRPPIYSVFPPERGMNLREPCGELKWQERADLKDGPSLVMLDERKAPPSGVAYAYRSIAAAAPTELTVTLSWRHAMAVWLNGEKVFRFETHIPFFSKDHNLQLKLRAGENALLVKIVQERLGGYAFGFRPIGPAAANAGGKDPGSEYPLGELWSLLARDFRGLAVAREMRWEREDGIWNEPPASPVALARRYAEAARAPAPESDALEALAVARREYLHTKRVADLGGRRDAPAPSLESLRLAIADLRAEFGPRYHGADEYLARLESLEGALKDPSAVSTFDQAYDDYQDLRYEALLANPLLDFDRLLAVKRFACYRNCGSDNGNEPSMPINWAVNSSLPSHGWDNEIAVLSPPRPDGVWRTVYRPQGTPYAGDVDLHWDAGRLLFSSLDANDRWQVFEVGLDGKGLRQVTPGAHQDVDNFDACYVPDGGVVYNSTATLQGVVCTVDDHVANLHRLEPDGKTVRRLCFDQEQNYTPSLTEDGRIIYTRWEYSDVAHVFARLLFAMNPDGTRQRAIYGSNSYWPTGIFYARSMPGHPTKVAAIVSGHHGCRRRGHLVILDPAQGEHETEGAVQMIPGRGKKVPGGVVDRLAANSFPAFLHPYPVSEKYILVACRPTQAHQWGLYLVDVFDNMLLLHEDPRYALYEPIPVKKRRAPPLIPPQTEAGKNEADVYLVDIYCGPGLAGVPRGAVKALRLYALEFGYRGLTGWVGDGTFDVRRILGTVPVERDGSAVFRVPPNTPISVQPLDEHGQALQSMRSWMTAMPGEKVSCVGCHERQKEAPPLQAMAALRRLPSEIQPWYGPARGMSFRREVLPVLEKRCGACHGAAGKRQAGAPPRFASANGNGELIPFLRRMGKESDYLLKVPGEYHADTSEVIQLLKKGHHGVTLEAEELDRLVTWIDLGCPTFAAWSEREGKKSSRHLFFERRKELRLAYAGIEDDYEALADPPAKVTPVMPSAPLAQPAEEPRCAGWPFDAAEAARRQKAAGPVLIRFEVSAEDGGSTEPLELAMIPAGEFVMGDPAGLPDEKPQVKGEIAKSFYMSRCEVSNALYALFDPHHDSDLFDNEVGSGAQTRGIPLNAPDQPAVRVSWIQATAFCEWLSRKTGKKFRLPAEAEWEYACRAGSNQPMWYGKPGADFAAFANFADRSRKGMTGNGAATPDRRAVAAEYDDRAVVSARCGSYAANHWGLYDMHGNVAEWTTSVYRPYPSVGAPVAGAEGMRVVRGGSWDERPVRGTASCRWRYPVWQRLYNVGFRVVCEQ